MKLAIPQIFYFSRASLVQSAKDSIRTDSHSSSTVITELYTSKTAFLLAQLTSSEKTKEKKSLPLWGLYFVAFSIYSGESLSRLCHLIVSRNNQFIPE